MRRNKPRRAKVTLRPKERQRIFAQRANIPTFEIASNPTIRLSEIKRRLLSTIDRVLNEEKD